MGGAIYTPEGTSWQFIEATFAIGGPLQLQTIKKIEGGSEVDTEAVYGAGSKMLDRTMGIIKTDDVKIEIGPSDWAALYQSLLQQAQATAFLYGLSYTGVNGMDLVLSPAATFNLTVNMTLVKSATTINAQITNMRLKKVPFSAQQGAAPVMMSLEFTCNDVQWSVGAA